jgi:hypothetical protein
VRHEQGAKVPVRKKKQEAEDLSSIISNPNVHAQVTMAYRFCMLQIILMSSLLSHMIAGWKRGVYAAAKKIHEPGFPNLIRRFLYNKAKQISHASDAYPLVSINACLVFNGMIQAYPSVTSVFYAPSDISGITSMRKEYICAVPRWRRGPARYDCVFVHADNGRHLSGPKGLQVRVARLRLLFSFLSNHSGKLEQHACALVHWFNIISDQPNPLTIMWIVQPAIDTSGNPKLSVIPITSIYRAAHLLPIFGETAVPRELKFSDSLNVFQSFYINKFIDHHAFEIAC